MKAYTHHGRWMLMTFLLLIVCMSGRPLSLQAQTGQTGELRGKVTSQQSGDPVVGATIMLVNTKLGAKSDLRGTYTIRRVPGGTYTVRVSSVGYGTKELSDVVITEGVAMLDIVLQDAAVQGKEVVVSAEGSKGTESALLNSRRKAATVNDGVSYAQIRRSPDATSGDALARVTGLSVISNKFVSIRGTSERYNSTQLNGVTMTSTEPDKKSFSFDLFPANLLENTIVSKTFTPDMPGDFTGGLVQLNTTDFPDRQTFRLSVSGSYDNNTTFQTIQLGQGGSTDWLGIDDGTRSLPGDLPKFLASSSDTSLSISRRYEIIRQFPNNWKPQQSNVPPNASFLLSYGDRLTVLENDFGILAAVSYRNDYSSTPILRRDLTRFNYSGIENSFSTLWGGLFNLSYKLSDLHTISVKNVYTHTSENRATFLEGLNELTSQLRRPTGFYYLERSFYSGQVNGEHLLPALGDLRIQWRGFGSIGNRSEPDFRRFLNYNPDPSDSTRPFVLFLDNILNPSFLGRVYSELDEEVMGSGADFSLPVGELKIKAGGLVENKSRDFSARSFAYSTSSFELQFPTAPIDSILTTANLDSGRIDMLETTDRSDRYYAHQNLNAAYAMVDAPFELFGEKFRAILGARLEDATLQLSSFERLNSKPVSVNYATSDVLPSLNLIYQLTPAINIRTAVSRTVTRPEFREIAPFAFYDFTTEQVVYGNPELRRTLSTNYDLRVEFFPDFGEVFAISFFHKDMKDAIEAVAITGDIPERTWKNTDKAWNTGIELELRKSFSFISESLTPFSFSANYTWLESKIEVLSDSLRVGKNGRRLQGQSPYMINVGLYFDNTDFGTSVTLLYNRSGERIIEVARELSPDFIEQPRNLLDFSVSQTLMDNYEAKLTLKNILGEDQVFTQEGTPVRMNQQELGVSLGISVKF